MSDQFPKNGGRRMLPQIRLAASCAKTVVKSYDGGAYEFKQYAFGEEGAYLPAALLREVSDNLCSAVRSFGNYDALLAPEPGGHTWGMMVSEKLCADCLIARLEKYPRGLTIRNAYSEKSFILPDNHGSKSVVILDDVINSGRTLQGLLTACDGLGMKVSGIAAICSRYHSQSELETLLQHPCHLLFHDNTS